MSTINANILKVTQLQHTNGTVAMNIDSSGRVLKPTQPAFAARGAEANATLTNGGDLPFNNAFLNVGGHFNTTTYRFTCPVTGVYVFGVNLFANGGVGRMSLKVNGTAYQNWQSQWEGAAGQWSASTIWKLNANDYVTVGDWQSISGATPYMGHSHFTGYLLG